MTQPTEWEKKVREYLIKVGDDCLCQRTVPGTPVGENIYTFCGCHVSESIDWARAETLKEVNDQLSKMALESIDANMELVMLRKEVEEFVRKLEWADDRLWFDPTPGGACLSCDANTHPNSMGKHAQLNGDSCPIQDIHDLLAKLKGKDGG